MFCYAYNGFRSAAYLINLKRRLIVVINLRCRQWRHNWHRDNSPFSVLRVGEDVFFRRPNFENTTNLPTSCHPWTCLAGSVRWFIGKCLLPQTKNVVKKKYMLYYMTRGWSYIPAYDFISGLLYACDELLAMAVKSFYHQEALEAVTLTVFQRLLWWIFAHYHNARRR